MNIEQARAHARYAFARLWRSGAMDVREACAWLLERFNVELVDDLTADECERLVVEIVRFWAERNAASCPFCRVPVRLDHAHALFDSRLYHINCIPKAA